MKIDLSGKTINQPSNDFFAELMGAGTNGGDIKQIDIALLDDFVGQPFKPYSPERLALLAEDIKENGVLSPLIIKPIDNGRYQILAGHNRKNAAIIAGLAKVPCIIKEVDEDGAKLILVNTNLNQRQELLPSEKAFAYKMQWGITKRQGQRTDLTSRHDVGKLNTEAFNESERTIERYIRLTYLNPELLDMVDKGQILVVAGVQLSYIVDGLQRIIYRALVDNNISKLKETTAKKLRTLAEVNELTEESIYDIFTPKEKSVVNTHYPVKEFVKTIKKLLPEDVTAEDAKAIAELIDSYFRERCE